VGAVRVTTSTRKSRLPLRADLMAELAFIKSSAGLIPTDEAGKAWFEKLRHGVRVVAKVTVPRNAKFHRKFFAMLHVAYDNYDWPTIETQHGPAQCTFEQFREYVTVKAGFFEMGATPEGQPRAKAKSIKFGKMDEAEFESLYSAVLDVILQRFLDKWKTADMERAVQAMLEFS